MRKIACSANPPSLRKKVFSLALVPFALWSSSVFAAWTLKGDESRVNFVSIKSDVIGEVNSFNKLDGKINEKGEFNFSIHLAGVETNIPIRNERMNEFLFETAKFPVAIGKGEVDVSELEKLSAGEVKTITVRVNIDLHGKSSEKNVVFHVAKLTPEKLWIVTAEPFLISAGEFGLTAGVEKLRELAGLPNIVQAIPVTASLIFTLDQKPSK